MKILYAILVTTVMAISSMAMAGFDGGNAPGGQQVGGKWYNPNQGTGGGSQDGYQEGGGTRVYTNPDRTQGTGAPTAPTQTVPAHTHPGQGCCCCGR